MFPEVPEEPEVPEHEPTAGDARRDESGPDASAAIAQLIGGDPLGIDLVRRASRAYPQSVEIQAALAIGSGASSEPLARAEALASTRRDRQQVAIVKEYLSGEAGRARLLARQHLAEFPDDILVSWLVRRS